MTYHDYLGTEHWHTVRDAAIRRAGGKCQACGSQENLNVHHNTYKRLWCEEQEDVVVFCSRCHEIFHDALPTSPDMDYDYRPLWPPVRMDDGTIRKGPEMKIVGYWKLEEACVG